VVERNGPTITIPVESQRATTALCEQGEVATGGGYTADVPVVIAGLLLLTMVLE
jgi:hypothetical protein